MASWGKAILFGFMIWLIPFVVAFIAFPLKESWRSLFESVMALTLSIVVVACALRYFSRVNTAFLREGIRLGILWFAISVVIDLPLMLSPPINYTLAEYAADIGLTYLMMPAITVGIALAISRKSKERNDERTEEKGGHLSLNTEKLLERDSDR
jgi:hypothetical protein